MNIKFMHTSDLYLGTKFNIKNFSLKERQKRREELWDTFCEIINIAKTDSIDYLFITGNLIHEEYADFNLFKKVINKFKLIPDTKIIIIFGKKDYYDIDSLYYYVEWPENVYAVKNSEIVKQLDFVEDNISIHALSCNKNDNLTNYESIYDSHITEGYTNLLLVNDESYGDRLDINLIKNKFDFCFLGGCNNYKEIEDNIIYVGSPEPIGFEDTKKHGIVKGSIDDGNIIYEFVPIAKRNFEIYEIDLENLTEFNKIVNAIKFSGDAISNIKNYVRIKLQGTIDQYISIEEIKEESKQFFYYIEFEDNYKYKTEEKIYDYNEFNMVESFKMQFENLDDKLQKQAYELGLELLRKEKAVK